MNATTSKASTLRMKLISAAVSSCFASAVLANPTGGVVVNGSASMITPLPGQLQITNSPNAIINWQGFSIAPGELTHFIQQSPASAVLNRVMTNSPSDILGTLQSNGRVFLINPNGIVFGSSAIVDVAGLVASTLTLTDVDFLAGHMRFQEVLGAGAVENQGSIFARPGGQVYLVGPAVTNGGLINSPQGEVILAAGNSVELMNTGTPGLSVAITAPDNVALNMGQIFADSGHVGIFAGVVNQGGVINANGAFLGPDGTIQLRASNATTFAAGSNTTAANLDIDTGSLMVAGNVSTGTQTIHATGGVVVQNELFGFAQLGASGGQTINAGYVEVNAVAGGSASIFNFGGPQHINTTAANSAGEGLAVRNLGGGFVGIQASGGEQHIDVRNADRAVVDGAMGFTSIINIDGVQTFSLTGSGANALVLGSPGALAQAVIGGGAHQTVVAGNPGEQGSITLYGTDGGLGNTLIVSNPAPGGTQSVSTTGVISVHGGSAPGNSPTGVFANGINGQQTIRAESILLQGGSVGNGNSAMIGANSGSQLVDVGAGGITLTGGAAGGNNFAMINQASTSPAATQTVTSAGPVHLEGGSGNFNFAMIRGFGGHQGLTFGDTTLLAGASGIDNFSVIQSRNQDVRVHGALAIVGRGSTGSPTVGGGARIGGLGGGAPSPTSLRLNVDGDFSMTGGTVSGTGVLLGNTVVFTGTADIDVQVGGDVTLNGGTAPGTFATIGSRASNLAGGTIGIAAGGDIALNSTAPDMSSGIRTTDGVTLTAQQITQGPDARIEAGSLTVQTVSGASLTGANAVDVFNASNGFSGDLAFNNASPLLTVTGAINPIGGVSLQQAGDMRVSGMVASGLQDINVTGGLVVQNDPFGFAQLGASGGQTINAGYVEVNAVAGGSASIFNFGGPQHITTTSANAVGEGLAVRAVDGGFALIDSPTGPQTIEVHNADSAVVDALSGPARITSFGGPQSIALSGTGANALVVGSPAATFQSFIGANEQSILAGNPGEQGSITVYGPRSVISSGPVFGGTQVLSTSGALSVIGGSALFGSSAGIFHNGTGQQTIDAQSVLVQGGATGAGNSALINSVNGAQTVNAGSISVVGGSGGTNNFAFLRSQAAPQTIFADEVTLNAGAGGTDNFAAILGSQQNVTVDGNVTISGGASLSTAFGGGAIIGGATSLPTNLVLTVGGDVTLNGGSVAGSGGIIGASDTGLLRTDITMNVGGNLTMNPGFGTGTRIGAGPANTAGGEIEVNAGGTIALNSTGPDSNAKIRTADGVTLRANSITQGIDSLIEAQSLNVESSQGALLTGRNSVNAFNAVNTEFGNVAFNNTSALLTVTGIDQVSHGALALSQSGDLRITGDVTSGAQQIDATGDMTIAAGSGPGVTVKANGAQTFNVGGSFSLLGGTAWNGYAQTLASGPVSIATGGDLNVRGGSGLLAYALLYGGDDIRLEVGNELHVDKGTGLLAFARVQADFRDRIYLSFPNRDSGGFFVNGREGVTHRGLNGFFTGLRPARLGRSLIVTYGE